MINNVTLIGRLVADPELRTTSTGKSVANFRIAVDRPYSKNGNKETDFITIVAWEKTADFISRHFTKGSMIALQGSIQTRNYEDSSGSKRTATEVLAKEVSFCGDKKDASLAPTSMSAPAGYEEIDTDDGLPY